jgi:hypothetical protein
MAFVERLRRHLDVKFGFLGPRDAAEKYETTRDPVLTMAALVTIAIKLCYGLTGDGVE